MTPNTLINGDALTVLRQMEAESVNFIITDPPYGVDFQSGRVERARRKDKIANDKLMGGDHSCIELFARETAAGWDSWGDEVPSDPLNASAPKWGTQGDEIPIDPWEVIK